MPKPRDLESVIRALAAKGELNYFSVSESQGEFLAIYRDATGMAPHHSARASDPVKALMEVFSKPGPIGARPRKYPRPCIEDDDLI